MPRSPERRSIDAGKNFLLVMAAAQWFWKSDLRFLKICLDEQNAAAVPLPTSSNMATSLLLASPRMFEE